MDAYSLLKSREFYKIDENILDERARIFLHNQFIKNNHCKQIILEWDMLYEDLGVFMCKAKKCLGLSVNELQKIKYFGCITLEEEHICEIIPIIIGTKLDRKLRGLECNYTRFDDPLATCIILKNSASFIPNFLTNNVKNAHVFKPSDKTKHTERCFMYNCYSEGFMIFRSGEKLVIRDPTGNQEEVGEEFTHHFSQNVLQRNVGYDDTEICTQLILNSDAYISYFKNLADDPIEVDSITNKTVVTGPTFLSMLVKQLYSRFLELVNFKREEQQKINGSDFCNDLDGLFRNFEDKKKELLKKVEDDFLKKKKALITKFKTIVGTGQFAFLVSKTSAVSVKSFKEQAKFRNRGNFTIWHDQTCKDSVFSQGSEGRMEICANQLKRFNNRAQYATSYLEIPLHAERIISSICTGNISNIGKRMSMTPFAQYSFFRNIEIRTFTDLILNKYQNCFYEHGSRQLVINSLLFPIFITNFLEFFLYCKYLAPGVMVHFYENFINVKIQNGILFFPSVVFDEKCCCSSNVISKITLKKRYKFEYRHHLGKLERCDSHMLFDPREVEDLKKMNFIQYEEPPLKLEIFDYSAIKECKFIESTPISKMTVTINGSRKKFKLIENSELLPTPMSELTQGFQTQNLRLFTLFYDFKMNNVEDGFCVGEHVKLPIIYKMKHSFTIIKPKSERMKPIKIFFKPELHYIRGDLFVGYLQSTGKLNFIPKRFSIIEFQEHVYQIWIKLHAAEKIEWDCRRNSNKYIFSIYITNKRGLSEFKLFNSYGQKGIAHREVFENVLVRENGKPVDITTNSLSLLKRKAIGQLYEQLETPEKVYHNGKYVGIGGYVDYFLTDDFPHDDIHGSHNNHPMRFDRLTKYSLLASGLSSTVFMMQNDKEDGNVLKMDRKFVEALESTKVLGKEFIFADEI